MLSDAKQVNNFLQSAYWAGFQDLIGRQAWHLDSDCLHARAYELPMRFGFKRLHIPRGPIVDISGFTKCRSDPVKDFKQWLETIGSEAGAMSIVVEPESDWLGSILTSYGFKHLDRAIQPSKTTVLDLDLSLSDLLSNFHHKLRYNINIAKKNDIKIIESDDIEPFLRLLAKTTERDNFRAHPDDYYRSMAKYFLGHKNMPLKIIYGKQGDNFCCGALILEYGDTCTYLHGASDYEFRNLMAPHLMHWEMIQDAKGRGLKLYDFWGIDDVKYPGVTRFKLQFGGRVVEYPGAFELPINQLIHFLYKLIRN